MTFFDKCQTSNFAWYATFTEEQKSEINYGMATLRLQIDRFIKRKATAGDKGDEKEEEEMDLAAACEELRQTGRLLCGRPIPCKYNVFMTPLQFATLLCLGNDSDAGLRLMARVLWPFETKSSLHGVLNFCLESHAAFPLTVHALLFELRVPVYASAMLDFYFDSSLISWLDLGQRMMKDTTIRSSLDLGAQDVLGYNVLHRICYDVAACDENERNLDEATVFLPVLDLVRLLIAYGADPAQENMRGEMPWERLLRCVTGAEAHTLRRIAGGESVTQKDNGYTRMLVGIFRLLHRPRAAVF